MFSLRQVLLTVFMAVFCLPATTRAAQQPHLVLVMADDQGWGQVGYNRHPLLKTPNLDAMAAAGLRFDRFYAGGPVCSPTRATVLTGRTNRRSGVESHGFALRRQERTLAQALQAAGYATGHFGKWHLNGMRGPGVPILAADTHNPGRFGFDEWLSVTNFFDRNPLLSRRGQFEEFTGDSSEIIVHQALQFVRTQVEAGRPTFTVIWYGSPHSPFHASEADVEPFAELDQKSRNQHGELVALDRSVGTLRQGLRELGIAQNTLVWYCSDNGGLPGITPATTGGLRGFKGSLYEGGLRVPAIIEWPAGISEPRITQYPACTMDMFPTIAEIVGLPETSMLRPSDGISLVPLFDRELGDRTTPIPFSCLGNTAILDQNLKLIHFSRNDSYEMYDLSVDPEETVNLFTTQPDQAHFMLRQLDAFRSSLESSISGRDYPEGELLPGDPEPRDWTAVEEYRPWFPAWRNRPEYRARLSNR